MIIGFYPGLGGNRYYLSTTGKDNFESGSAYDSAVKDQLLSYRYLSKDTIGLPDKSLILTHCVNVPLLQQHFPGHTVVIILGNLQAGLRREWCINGFRRDIRILPTELESAQSTINFHQRYYEQVPVDTVGADVVIDIDTDVSAFASMIRQELSLYKSLIFDQAYMTTNSHSLQDLPGDKIVDGFKSKFLDDAERMKQQLDSVSPSLCLAKWKQVSLHLATGLNNSCYHPPLHQIPVEEIQRNVSALHNTQHKKEQRQLMLNGQRPSECQYCWNMEDLGKMSDRHYRSGEPWAAVDFGKIASSDWNQDDIIPSYVEVNFNNACNLKCSYCSPQFSSSWMDESNRLGAFPTAIPHNAPEHFTGSRRVIPAREHNPYVEAFWSWWPRLYPELRHFRMTGGEPLMDRNTYRVFDWVLEHPKSDLHLNVTSNFSVEDSLFEKYISYVKRLCNTDIEHFMQYVSLDSGQPAQAEYIRHGLDYDRMAANVEQYLNDIPYRNSLTFIVTMNNLSVTGLKPLLEWILDLRQRHSTTYQRVWFDTPVLRQPAWQSLQLLPESYAAKLEEIKQFMEKNLETSTNRFHGFKDYEISRLDRDIAWMREGQRNDNSKAKADFYRFFAEHDRRRNTDFLAAFPEMRAWWTECQYWANRA